MNSSESESSIIGIFLKKQTNQQPNQKKKTFQLSLVLTQGGDVGPWRQGGGGGGGGGNQPSDLQA